MEGEAFGRYRLVELLGRGGMGEVWRAFDSDTNRMVAVKVLPTHLANNPTFEQRFRREAFAAAGLNNPHVIPIHNFGEIDGRLYVDMRLIDGRDLQRVLAEGPLPPSRAVGIIGQVAEALHAAHKIGLVHRDIKPSNVLIDEDDFAYLIDFGIARAAGESGLTSTGSAVGTWDYMAPERFQTGDADSRADVYALTCVLYQCLSGRLPFPGESLEQVAAGHMFRPPPRPSDLRVEVPAPMDHVVATGMAKNPDDRYQTTRKLAAAARDALMAGHAAATRTAIPPPPRMPEPPPAAVPPRPGHPNITPTQLRAAGPPGHGMAGWKAEQWAPAYPQPPSGPPPPHDGRRRRNRRIILLAGGAVALIVVATAAVIALLPDKSISPAAQGPSSSPSSSEASLTSSSESIPQQSLTRQAVHNACDVLRSSSQRVIDAVNAYVAVFNNSGAAAASTAAVAAIDALNNSADLVSGSISPALSPQLRDDSISYVNAARGLAQAISSKAASNDFNAAVNKLNATKASALQQCAAAH